MRRKIVGVTVGTTISPEKLAEKLPSGNQGKSAYEIAVENGFEGTVTEWLESLKGNDYLLTDGDKAEMVNAVIALLPVYGGETE